MDPNTSGGTSKSALDLAVELGVRTQTILGGLQSLGIDAENASETVDSDVESMLVDHLIQQGQISSKLKGGKGRRSKSDDPVVDDDILTEALGASETGFQQSRIPRQFSIESDFEESPSFFQRWFGKKKNLARNLKEHALSDEEISSMFQSRSSRQDQTMPSPFQDQGKEDTGDIDMDDYEETDQEQADEGMEDLELDEDLIDDLEDIDIEQASDELGDIDVDDLEDIDMSDISDEDDTGEGEASDEDVDIEDLDTSFEDEEGEGETSDEEGEGEEEGQETEEEEEEPSSFVERFLSRIQLTQLEMYSLLGAIITLMLITTGFMIYYMVYRSPDAQLRAWEEANDHYELALEYDRNDQFEEAIPEFQTAVTLFEEFINEFPTNQNVPEAYEKTSNSYYQIATAYEQLNEEEKSEEPYRLMAEWYGDYLAELEERAMKQAEKNLELPPEERDAAGAYVDPAEQRKALLRIALAQRKLNRFENAVQKLKEFIERYEQSEDAIQARIDLGETYERWAEVDKEQEDRLLNNAISVYEQALDHYKDRDDHINAMNMNAKLGNINRKLYQRYKPDKEQKDNATAKLRDAIGYYEKAEEEARQIDISLDDLNYREVIDNVNNVFNELADLYLIRGEEAGDQWKEFEKNAADFPEGMPPKKQLEEEAQQKKRTAEMFLDKANELYSILLDKSELLDSDTYHNILYNRAKSRHIMRDYTGTIAAGEMLLNSTQTVNPEIKTKTLYLLGDAAWKQAQEQEGKDYSLVKKYYIDALKANPLYPRDQNGEVSNLAEIRLTNVYLQTDQDFEEAIRRFEIAKQNYPNTGYTYLTLYYYADALDRYGDTLLKQAMVKEQDAQAVGGSPVLMKEAENLREKAKQQFEEAVTQYNAAISARDDSRFGDPINKTYLIEIKFRRGHSAYKAGNYRDAQQYLEEALAEYQNENVAPKYIPKAIERLGDINADRANYDKAVEYYKQYLGENYENTDERVRKKLANAYRKGYSFDNAREIYRQIIKDNPPPTESEVNRLKRVGLPVKKGPAFEAMKGIAETYYTEAKRSYGDERIDNLKQTLTAYDALIDHYPLPSEAVDERLANDPDSLEKIAKIHYELGLTQDDGYENFKKAAENYEAYLSTVSTNDEKLNRNYVYWQLGKCYMQMKDEVPPNNKGNVLDKAIQALGNISSDTLYTPENYADALILLGRAYESRANEFLRQNNNDVDLYLSYMEKAVQTFEQVNLTKVPEKITIASNLKNDVENLIATQRNKMGTGLSAN